MAVLQILLIMERGSARQLDVDAVPVDAMPVHAQNFQDSFYVFLSVPIMNLDTSKNKEQDSEYAMISQDSDTNKMYPDILNVKSDANASEAYCCG